MTQNASSKFHLFVVEYGGERCGVGQADQGELYVVGYEGMIYKLELDRAVFE